MEIYVIRISPLLDEELFRELLQLLPEERQMKIERLRGTRDQCRSLGAGLLLEYGLNRQGMSLSGNRQRGKKVVIGDTEHGKPCISGYPQICFNLSHSGEYAAAVFAEREAGIDLEEMRNAGTGMKVARRFFMPEESAYLGGFTQQEKADLAFTELWTRKESYIKAVGTGLALPMNTFSVLHDEVVREAAAGPDAGSLSYYLQTFHMPKGYCISVCSLEKPDVQPKEITLSEMI